MVLKKIDFTFSDLALGLSEIDSLLEKKYTASDFVLGEYSPLIPRMNAAID